MNLTETMKERHSVRQYEDRPLERSVVSVLQDEIKACNKESGLHIQLVTNEPKAFAGFMAHYGKFSGVTDYIAMIGKKGPDLEEKCDEALGQIEEQKYEEALRQEGYQDILKYGVAFYRKECMVKKAE